MLWYQVWKLQEALSFMHRQTLAVKVTILKADEHFLEADFFVSENKISTEKIAT